MKIAAFYSDSPFAGWVQAGGFAEVLSRMGHDVVPIPVPPTKRVTREQVNRINKPIDDCEAILVSGPEWLHDWIVQFYPNWDVLPAPKVGWYHESFDREDLKLDYARYHAKYDYHFFPCRADAERYGGQWLPLGADVSMFNPPPMPISGHCHEGRDIGIAFIGLMYEKRREYIEQLGPSIRKLPIRYMTACQSDRGLMPAIGAWNAEGIQVRLSMQLLAEEYRRIRIFLTLPSVSDVLVAKVLESMACGCCLVAPRQPVDLYGYLSYSSPTECVAALESAWNDPGFAERTADEGRRYVLLNHRMEQRFEEIFRRIGK